MSLWPSRAYRLSPAGPKETILFLHGFMGNKDDWQDVAGRLGEDYRTLAVDLPGHGVLGQMDNDDAFRMEPCARGLIDLLDDLKLGPCHLVGYSMGGRVGLYLMLQYPRWFRDAVLESTSPGLATEEERADRRAHDESLARQLQTGDMKAFVANWYRQPMFRQFPAGQRLEAMLERRAENSPDGLARSLRFMGTGVQPSLWERLDGARRPMLFVAGIGDEKFSRIAAEMEERCPVGKAVMIENAGHNVHFEQPESYTELLRLFFEQNRENEHVDDNVD